MWSCMLQVVQAQNSTVDPMTMSKNDTMTSTAAMTITSKDKNGSGRTDPFTLLLPLALAASLLHGWS